MVGIVLVATFGALQSAMCAQSPHGQKAEVPMLHMAYAQAVHRFISQED